MTKFFNYKSHQIYQYKGYESYDVILLLKKLNIAIDYITLIRCI